MDTPPTLTGLAYGAASAAGTAVLQPALALWDRLGDGGATVLAAAITGAVAVATGLLQFYLSRDKRIRELELELGRAYARIGELTRECEP